MPKSKASWFRMSAKKAVGDISIFGNIGGFGLDAQAFSDALDALGDVNEIKIRIDSDGGDVTTGFNLYNMLALHPAKKTVTIMGLAASMASVVAMAGDKRIMPKNAMMMIHNPVGAISGQSQEIIEFGKAVGDMRKNIATAYADASGQSLGKIMALMDKQTWLSADRAKMLGLATEVTDPIQIAAHFDISRYANAPASYGEVSRTARGKAMTTRTDDFTDEDQAATRKSERESILAQQKQVNSLCVIAGKPELAAKFNEDDADIATVIAKLDELKKADIAAAAKKGVNGNRRQATGTETGGEGDVELNAHSRVTDNDGGNVIDGTKIWARFNAQGRRKNRAA